MEREHWIKVITSTGMFKTEYAIALKLANGNTVSFFVDKRLVRDGNPAQLKVTLIKRNKDTELVLLPTEAMENASQWAEIPLE